MVAVGTAQPIPLTTGFGLGSAFLDALVPWGIGIIGLGVLLGFFGAAVKGPSMEWRDVGPDIVEQPPIAPRAPGYHYACPGCGGDVYSSQAVCPECGHQLTVRSAPSP